MMLIANISRNIVQEARRFISDTQTRSNRSRQDRPQNRNKRSENVSVVSEERPSIPRFTSIDTTRRMQIESHLRDARDLARDFYGSRPIERILPASTPASDFEIGKRNPSNRQSAQSLQHISTINSQKHQPYAASDPVPIAITTGVQENGLALNRIL